MEPQGAAGHIMGVPGTCRVLHGCWSPVDDPITVLGLQLVPHREALAGDAGSVSACTHSDVSPGVWPCLGASASMELCYCQAWVLCVARRMVPRPGGGWQEELFSASS